MLALHFPIRYCFPNTPSVPTSCFQEVKALRENSLVIFSAELLGQNFRAESNCAAVRARYRSRSRACGRRGSSSRGNGRAAIYKTSAPWRSMAGRREARCIGLPRPTQFQGDKLRV
jgi:hypothetical protein